MNKKLQTAIESWVSRPTWFSSPPSETKELKKATFNLRKLITIPTEPELKETTSLQAKDLSTTLKPLKALKNQRES